jgi:hypothetical protein
MSDTSLLPTGKLPEAAPAMTPAQQAQLFKQVRATLGEPGRLYPELTDEALLTQLELAMDDYWSIVYEWLTSQQWGNLQGQDVNTTNFVLAFTNRSLDYTHQFTAAYGKQTGIGSLSTWELKKDYIETVAGQQVYEIPAGREVNEVLWHTPPVLAGGAGGQPGSAGWLAQSNGWLYGNQPAAAILPTYSTLLVAQDRLQRNRVNMSEHTYKITAGPEGTKHLHLYPVPGSVLEIPGPNGRHEAGSFVWYWYYDTNEQGRDKCAEANADIIHLPDEVPLQQFNWGKMNVVSRTRVRKLLVRNAVRYVGIVRGLFKGEMPSPSKEGKTITVDYQMLLDLAKTTEEAVLKEIAESLDKITTLSMLKRQAEEARALHDTIKFQPARQPFIMG